MTRLLLDTTFLIDIERGDADLDAAVHDDDDVAIATITAAELRVGAELATGKRRAKRRAFVDAVLDTIPTLGYDDAVAIDHAELLVATRRSGTPRGAHDLIIAATALTHGRTIVSADRSAFADLPNVRVADHRS